MNTHHQPEPFQKNAQEHEPRNLHNNRRAWPWHVSIHHPESYRQSLLQMRLLFKGCYYRLRRRKRWTSLSYAIIITHRGTWSAFTHRPYIRNSLRGGHAQILRPGSWTRCWGWVSEVWETAVRVCGRDSCEPPSRGNRDWVGLGAIFSFGKRLFYRPRWQTIVWRTLQNVFYKVTITLISIRYW